jgi:hypothetical protein
MLSWFSLPMRFLLSDWIRVRQKLKSGQLMVSGDHWPVFLYQNHYYDDEDPWKGLLRSSLLVKVRRS